MSSLGIFSLLPDATVKLLFGTNEFPIETTGTVIRFYRVHFGFGSHKPLRSFAKNKQIDEPIHIRNYN